MALLAPEKLAASLRRQLLFGEEPLLHRESCDLIRARAREEGVSDREVLEAGEKNFNWQELLDSAASLSLFAGRKLIELRIPDGKPGAEGSRALCDYVARGDTDNVLLVSAGKIDRQSQSGKWFKTLAGAGAAVQASPVSRSQLPAWLEKRFEAAGMHIAPDALQMLCERVEGNLLAAVQEVEKLQLLAPEGNIDTAVVVEAVSDNARFNLFAMVDDALAGNTAAALRMLRGLAAEGTDATVIVWALGRELRALHAMKTACESGRPLRQVLASHRVWRSREGVVQQALQRHSSDSLGRLLAQLAVADGSIKGFADGRPWDHLEGIVVVLGQPDSLPVAF